MATVTLTLERIEDTVASIHKATLEQIHDGRSRLAGIRDPALHFIMRMLWPQPVCSWGESDCNFIYEYGGKYYIQYYEHLQPVRKSDFMTNWIPVFDSCGALSYGRYYCDDCDDRVVRFSTTDVKRDPKDRNGVLGRLPPDVFAVHIDGMGPPEFHQWTAIDAMGKLRRMDPGELLPC